MFYYLCLFFIYLFATALLSSHSRSPWNCRVIRYLGALYNVSPKIGGFPRKKFVAKNMQNLDQFYTTLDFDYKYFQH